MNGLTSYAEPKSKQERRERRSRLEKERDTVRSQLSDLKYRLSQLQKGAGPAKGPSKQGGVSKKRPAAGSLELSGDAKRQKVEAERAKRVNSIWQQCHTILKTLLKSKDAFAFSKPVNPITAKCPDYHDIIKKPMDLGTIQKKFPGKGRVGEKRPELREYKTPYEFRDDVRLVWANCRTYNAVGHAVRTMGDTLSETWEKKWALSGLETKWEDEMRRQELEEQELTGGTSLAQQMQVLDDALQQRVKQAENQPGYSAAPEGNAMNFEQKRRLSIMLGQLPGDKIATVMRIISEDESMRQKADSNEEIEVDIDQLSTEVLWKLDRYANSVLQSLKKRSNHKPAEAQAGNAGAPAAAANGKDGKMPNGGTETPAAERSSSSSSSDSDTDRSQSDSEGEVGSKDLGASQHSGPPKDQQRPTGGGNDAATLVSATRPPGQPQIVKNMASKKEVNLQNANAWADLGNVTKQEEPAGDGAPDEEGEDNLWDEFKSREQEEEQRAKEKRALEEKQQIEEQKAEEAARAEAERLRKEAEDAERAEKEEEENRIKAQREKEMEEMQKAGKGPDFAAGALELLDSKKQGDTLTDVLGLQRKDSDSEDEGGSDSDS